MESSSRRHPEKMDGGTKQVFSNSFRASENSPTTYGDRTLEAGSQKRWKIPKIVGSTGEIHASQEPKNGLPDPPNQVPPSKDVPRIEGPCEARQGPKPKEKASPNSQCPFFILFQGRSPSPNLWVTQSEYASFLRADPFPFQMFTLLSLYETPGTKLGTPGIS